MSNKFVASIYPHSPYNLGSTESLVYGSIFVPEKLKLILDGMTTFLPLVFQKHNVATNEVTLVGRGFSGAVVIPTLAANLGCKMTLIRKEQDDRHSANTQEGLSIGACGTPWIFVDDLIDTGHTRQSVIDVVGYLPVASVLYGHNIAWKYQDKQDLQPVYLLWKHVWRDYNV